MLNQRLRPQTDNVMMKFIKFHMSSIDGVEIFPLISFLIFFVFFVGLTIYTFSLRKSHVSEMSQMPLQDDADEFEASNPNSELK